MLERNFAAISVRGWQREGIAAKRVGLRIRHGMVTQCIGCKEAPLHEEDTGTTFQVMTIHENLEGTWISAASWHLLSGSRHLTQRIGIRAHVREDDQHVLAALVGEILCSCQSDSWSDDALNGRIVCQIQEQYCLLHRSILLKVLQSIEVSSI